jgi:hypothetical protein
MQMFAIRPSVLKNQLRWRVANRAVRLCLPIWLLFLMLIPSITRAQSQPKGSGSQLVPDPAIPGVLAAFDKYEVVAIPEGHGLKDLDDFILTLIRTPAFAEKVNDIEVECGNSLYQAVLDRYIAGDDVPFEGVQKVWRNTTQDMCGASVFFEEFFPVVRAVNKRLPPEKRIRVLAGDPPVDWEQVREPSDLRKLKLPGRDANAASVLENAVISKGRKALILFGTFHLFHGGTGDFLMANAVSIIEAKHPGTVFVVSDLNTFGSDFQTLTGSTFSSWPVPSLARTKGTWFGAMDASQFLPKLIFFDGCDFRYDLPEQYKRPVAELLDAILYLGPVELSLEEQWPVDLAFDDQYRKELARRDTLTGSVGLPRWSDGFEQDVLAAAENPFVPPRKLKGLKSMTKACLEEKSKQSAKP